MQRTAVFIMIGLCSSITLAAESASVIRADSLREKPFADAKILGPLSNKQSLQILSRTGAWYQVQAGKQNGWVRMLSVRRTQGAANASASSLASIDSGRSGTGKITATTGIRGFGEEQLKQAAFDEAAVSAAEKLRTDETNAREFALAGKLGARALPELPVAAKGKK